MRLTQRKRHKRNYVTPSGIIIELEATSSILSTSQGLDGDTGDAPNSYGIQLQDADNTEIIP